MEYSDKRSVSSTFFTVAIITVILGVIFYVSSDYYTQRHPDGRKEFDYAGRPVQPSVTTGQLILPRNKKFIIGRNCLVFKGVKRKTIIIDLYLLDLDPEESFEKRFIKKDAKKEMLLGEGRYQLLSVNDNNLVLKKI